MINGASGDKQVSNTTIATTIATTQRTHSALHPTPLPSPPLHWTELDWIGHESGLWPGLNSTLLDSYSSLIIDWRFSQTDTFRGDGWLSRTATASSPTRLLRRTFSMDCWDINLRTFFFKCSKLLNISWQAMPMSIGGTKAADTREEAPRLTMPGPGQTPHMPHPTPKNTAPRTKEMEMLVLAGCFHSLITLFSEIWSPSSPGPWMTTSTSCLCRK